MSQECSPIPSSGMSIPIFFAIPTWWFETSRRTKASKATHCVKVPSYRDRQLRQVGQDRVSRHRDPGQQGHVDPQRDLPPVAQQRRTQGGHGGTDRLVQNMSLRWVNRERPPHQSLQLQGHLLVGACGVPQELDKQQGQTLTQRHRHLLQFQQILVRDLQDLTPQASLAAGRDRSRNDHLRQTAKALCRALKRHRKTRTKRRTQRAEPARGVAWLKDPCQDGPRPSVLDQNNRYFSIAHPLRDQIH